ncbi:hypothetical protein SEVIR_1G229100v4 [Setaria viridis]|uniref:Uncharacterized protein n=1 Tax=Setaria viridis TaxID=4556 RepID=A0A4U6WEJ0_SETVI|nr:uncharacterized protein LOC117860890 isoform X1 [Setaria viridis]TKW40173.1 hypothetical protein SEVIR_1G229100v2 [Setaria viridis]
MEFTFEDAEELCSLVSSQESLVDKKRRWLESMILKPGGCSSRVKRPKFLDEAYLPESYIRSGEISCEKVRASMEKSLSSESNGYTHHIVQDGLRLFDLQKKENEPFGPEYLGIIQSTISKLTYETLQSVACIVTRNKFSFDKTRLAMEKIVESHLPSYLAKLDHKELFYIFRNPCSYRSGSVRLVTPVSPQLLSAIHHALDGLDEMPMQPLVAMNRKIREKSCTPKFGFVARSSNRGHIIEIVRKRCNKILTELEEGNYLPKNLAKAMSVANLYKKQKLRSVDISQSEFFPFTKETISLQNDILNALWSLPKLRHDKRKLLRPILDQDSKVERTHLKAALRNYLTDCLFECDEGSLPDEALQAIAFINRTCGHQQVVLTEKRKEVEVDAVLNLSSHLQALAHCCVEECSCGEELISLGNDSCNEDNDFILSGTNYFNLSSVQQPMQEPCCSSNIGTDLVRECCWSETVGDMHNVSGAEDSGPKSEEMLSKPCLRTEDSGGIGHYSGNEAAGSGMGPYAEKSVNVSHLKESRCSEINGICDETSIVAHKLIGQILDKWLLVNEVDEPSRSHLGSGLVSQSPQDDDKEPVNSTENLEGDIFTHAVERVLPNLPKSCIDKVKRLMS